MTSASLDAERSDHELARTMEMIFLCKKCKKAFRKVRCQTAWAAKAAGPGG